MEKDIILTDTLNSPEIPADYLQHYFTHILCEKGQGQFIMDNKEQNIGKNDICFWLPNASIGKVLFSPDFSAIFLLVSFDMMSKNNPDIGWGIKAYMFSKENPVVNLEPNVVDNCKKNFLVIYKKYTDESHRFRMEIVNLHLKILIMEMWNVFADKMEQNIKSNVKGAFFQRFLQLAEMHCMENREVEFYADKLFITPKYLSEICKKTSGKTASEWIQNYATTRLILLLRNNKLTFTQIADSMNFSSQSFFSRYVRKVLGVSPSVYRERLRD
ncbi:MAG: helix-turn-helix domain-containing protein [Proteiniphilum sp.]|jgi:AraC-like DNA-binding protein|nr:helix-turn-helix domain-containing protein [Proteiniphilum sp.]MDY0183903.1 helix-turn-helix domain-containing protein [Proteiniphilum sp.]